MMLLVTIVTVSWLVSMAAAIKALFLTLHDEVGNPVLCIALTALALTIGYLGFGHWSPFRFFPQIGWMYTSDNLRIHVASSWFFVVPLALGATVILILLTRKIAGRRSKRDL